MKFVYFGYDFMIGGVQRLLRDGHDLIGVFSFPCDNVFNFNMNARALAAQREIPFLENRPQPSDIEEYINQGAQCFLSVGYPYKIPPIDESRAYGINLHPSLLPLGRGLMPTPYIIMDHPQASGMTVHKITPEFDAGDILHQIHLPVHECETVETLSARIAMRGPDILSMLMSDLRSYWNQARPQNHRKATRFPPPEENMRLLDWTLPIQRLDKIARAFGRYGSVAQFDNDMWVVYDHDCWEERHNLKPGTVACLLSREIVIAAKDGFFCLKEFHKARME